MQDNTYLGIFDKLISFKNSAEVADFFDNDQTYLNDQLLEVIDERISFSKDTYTIAFLQNLRSVIWDLICNQCLVCYLSLEKDESIAFANSSYAKLLNEYNFKTVEQLWQNLKGDDLDRFLFIEKQSILVNAAVNWAISFMDWPGKRPLYLYGLSWMTHEITRMILDDLAQQSEQHRQYVINLRELISRCHQQGAEQVILEYDVAYLLTLLPKMSLIEKVPCLLQMISISDKVPHDYWQDVLEQLQKTLALLKSGEWKSAELRNLTDQLLGAIIDIFPRILKNNPTEINQRHGTMIKMNLATAYMQRLETRSHNTPDAEKAIVILGELLLIFDQYAFPDLWASLNSMIGLIYTGKFKADRQEKDFINAKDSFQKSLSVYQKTDEQYDLGTTWQRLGELYQAKCNDKSSDNFINDAIAAFEKALLVFSREKFPLEWAKTKGAIGTTFWLMISKDRSFSVQAVDAFQEVLSYTSIITAPEEWANAHYHLGLIFNNAGLQSPENMEVAISSFSAALDYYTPNNHPMLWANIMYNLGSSYLERRAGEPKDNIEEAIIALNAALRIVNHENATQTWARIHNNLGIAHRNRLQGNKPDNVRAAIGYYTQALTIRTKNADPFYWARMQHNLGNAFADEELDGDRSAHIEAAIEALNRALEYRTKAYPSEWALTINSRGLMYAKRLTGVPEQNFRMALADYLAALEVTTIEKNTKLYRIIYYNLGILYYENSDWETARRYFEESVKAIDFMLEHVSLFDSRSFITRETTYSYSCLIHCCLELGDFEAAIANNIAKKGRAFSEQLLTSRLERNPKDLDKPGVSMHYFQGDSNRRITLLEILHLQTSIGGFPILEYVKHSGGWGVFVICNGRLNYIKFAGDFYQQLTDSFTLLMMGEFWTVKGSEERLAKMYELLIQPVEHILPKTGNLVISPTESLQLIPFQSLIDNNGVYFCERFILSFVPNLTAWHIMINEQRNRSQKQIYHQLLNIAFAEKNDPIFDEVQKEAEIISSYFVKPKTLLWDQATASAVIRAMNSPENEVIHLNCHGHFNFFDPGASGISLAQESQLTVREIIGNIRFTSAPLITLSACQSGIVKPVASDESTVLSWALLAAGASGVLASLWSVNAQATRILFTYFYKIRTTTKDSHADVLNQSMSQLRLNHPEFAHPKFWSGFQVTGLSF